MMAVVRSKRRDVDGVLLLDKPIGLSSNEALQKVKRLFHANKAGHTGALDPLASGMLPICFGEATKFSRFLLDADKRYRVTARLGERTTTSDAEGEIIDRRAINVNREQIESALDQFRGTIQQVPSMFSALKYQGRPLYEYARQGIEVPRQARQITLYEIQFIGWQHDELELEVHCSKGTYIRTLIDDLGESLGCGAHVIELRRLQVENYPVEAMVTLETLQAQPDLSSNDDSSYILDALLMPMTTLVRGLPEVNIEPVPATHLKQGKAIVVEALVPAELVCLTEGQDRVFIGVGMVDEQGRIVPHRLVRT